MTLDWDGRMVEKKDDTKPPSAYTILGEDDEDDQEEHEDCRAAEEGRHTKATAAAAAAAAAAAGSADTSTVVSSASGSEIDSVATDPAAAAASDAVAAPSSSSSSSSSSESATPWRDEVASQLKIAGPVVLTFLTRKSVDLVSVIFVGHLGAEYLSAAGTHCIDVSSVRASWRAHPFPSRASAGIAIVTANVSGHSMVIGKLERASPRRPHLLCVNHEAFRLGEKTEDCRLGNKCPHRHDETIPPLAQLVAA